MQTKNAQKLVSTIDLFINPVSYQENDIINLVTKAVMLEKIKHDICLIEVGVSKVVSEYDQEIQQSQTADNPVAPRGRAAQPSRDTRKTN